MLDRSSQITVFRLHTVHCHGPARTSLIVSRNLTGSRTEIQPAVMMRLWPGITQLKLAPAHFLKPSLPTPTIRVSLDRQRSLSKPCDGDHSAVIAEFSFKLIIS
ncbi:hypothetical protein BaRGS_00004913 [Batillaria attramentaria]|uniref:Uncharacterized protein n=1 Tax=Batillaria attramentaria TaxID=370345 RepID=A0ABD0LX95_9CAEN